MCVPILSTPKPPSPPEPPQIAPAPKLLDPDQRKAREEEKRRARAAYGQRRTILTGSLGLGTPATTTKSNLLGQ